MFRYKEGAQSFHILDMIDRFLTYLEITKNSSPYTLRNYRACMNRFILILRDTPITDITQQHVDNYRSLLFDMKISKNWAFFHLHVLKSFLRWCWVVDIPTLHYKKIDIPKNEPNSPAFLFRHEMDMLFAVQERTPKLTIRNQAIIKMLYSTGCRLSEISMLNRNDLSGLDLRVKGKGNKYRIVFLSVEASEQINKYLSNRTDIHSPLFISFGRKGNHLNPSEARRLSKTMIERIVRLTAKKAGIDKKVTPHTLRHTFATEMLRNGAPIYAVKDLLGHTLLSTTQIYLHVTDPWLREAHQTYHR